MNEDQVIKKLFEHDKQFEDLRNELHGFKAEVSTKQDKIITILERLDHERVFSARWIERVESEISKIKQALKL